MSLNVNGTMTASANDNWVRRFIVSDPRKHRKGFTVYKVTSIVFPKASPEAATKVVVWKRYNDFRKLHRELKYKHKKLYFKDKFPSFVKAKFFGRFEEDVIEERRKCAMSLLEFIGNHPPLFTTSVFVKFFESGYTVDEISQPVAADLSVYPVVENASHDESALMHVNGQVLSPCEVRTCTENPRNGLEEDGPLLKLGGTWQYPQVPDSISLSSHSSDDHTTFTDTDSALSGVSTPLQSADLHLFDPLHHSPAKQGSNNYEVHVSDSWLLSIPFTPVNHRIDIHAKNTLSETIAENTNGDKAEECENMKPNSISGPRKEVTGQGTEPSDVCLLQTEGSSNSEDPVEDVSASSSKQSQNVSYIFKADYQIGQALQHEANGEYNTAFALYKAGIASLLNGVQGDTDIMRKRIVREKTAKYLLQAEKIYNEHLALKSEDSFRWNMCGSQLCRPLCELKAYKVLGIIHKVMLVLNVHEDQCYVIKVLHKSPCPLNQNKQSIIPQNVPYMVAIHQYFETDSAVFLVLHHASGGRLWDHVSSYFQSLPPTPVHMLGRENAYLGKKLIQDEKKCSAPDLETSLKVVTNECTDDLQDAPALSESNSSHDHSYVELIRDYTSAKLQLSPLVSKGESSCVYSEKSCTKQLNKLTDSVLDLYHNLDIADECEKTSCENESEIQEIHKRLESSLKELAENEVVNNQMKTAVEGCNYNSVPDLLPQSSNYSLSWKNLEAVETADLVENAQRLIQSVSETLLKSDAMDISLPYDSCSPRSVNLIGNHGAISCTERQHDYTEKLVSQSEIPKSDMSAKTIVRCKSEDNSCTSKSKGKERRCSTGRRCSVTRPSIERRFSSDDLFESRARTASGSLDRAHQWMRFDSVFDCPKPHLPEATVRQWAAELLVCMECLHRWGVICRDLRPENVLLGEKGHLLLTFMCKWSGVDSLINTEAVEWLYAAPEATTIFDLTPAADWWSFGALIFELVTGKSLLSCHPGGIHSHTILNIPDYVSEEAHSLLTELLRHNPQERLGSGINGVEDLKSHPFFKGINWQELTNTSSCV